MKRGDFERNKTHCPYGHPYSGDNLIIETKSNGKTCRRCRICKNKNSLKSQSKNIERVYSSHKKYRENNPKHVERWERNSTLKKKGISVEQYNEMLVSQNYVCFICKSSCPTGKHLSIDHDHITGNIRGLLCKNCNTGLGCFKDNIQHLEKAINYLKKNKNV